MTVAVPPSGYAPPPPGGDDRHRRSAWLPWTAGAVALVVVLVVATVLLVRGDGGTAEDPGTASAGEADKGPGQAGPGEPVEPSDPTDPVDPTDADPSADAGPVGDVTTLISRVEVPGTAPASTDARTGAPVTFESANLTDGDPTTCWRVAGDASGTAITLRFDEPVQVTGLGLVNGYAKSYPGYDGYRLNRRVLEVDWVFDDGSTVTQPLSAVRSMQSVAVTPTWTEELRIEIVAVSPPAKGPVGKDFTPISEIAIEGATAG